MEVGVIERVDGMLWIERASIPTINQSKRGFFFSRADAKLLT